MNWFYSKFYAIWMSLDISSKNTSKLYDNFNGLNLITFEISNDIQIVWNLRYNQSWA
jgi:hypothetical protein